MKKFFHILIILLFMGVIISAGCTQGTSSSVPENSDDDLYLISLNDFISAVQQSPRPSGATFSDDTVLALEMKNRSTSYYNSVMPLRVTSKFEYSKASFLQALKDSEAFADYALRFSQEERTRFGKQEFQSASEKQQYEESVQHAKNKESFMIKAFDSNICSAANEKYANVTRMCNVISKMTK